MPVRADAAEEKADAAQGADLRLVLRAILVDAGNDLLLHLFKAGFRLPGPQREVNDLIRKDLRQGFALGHAEAPGVDEQGLAGIQTKAADIERIDIMMKAVDLGGTDGIKLIDLDEAQAGHLRFDGRVDAVRLEVFADFRGIPVVQIGIDPFNEMFRGFSGRQGDDALRIILYPFQEAERGQFAEHGKIIHLDHSDLFLRFIDEFATAPFDGEGFHSRGRHTGFFFRHGLYPLFDVNNKGWILLVQYINILANSKDFLASAGASHDMVCAPAPAGEKKLVPVPGIMYIALPISIRSRAYESNRGVVYDPPLLCRSDAGAKPDTAPE